MGVKNFRGRPACACLVKWLPAFEKELQRRGILSKGQQLRIYQLIGGAAASANTHSTGGAADLGVLPTVAIEIARNMGAAAFLRTGPAWDPDHVHLVLNDCPHNKPARYQVAALERGDDGLGRNGAGGRDTGPRENVAWPLRTWREGLDWAKHQGRARAIAGVLLVRRPKYIAVRDTVFRSGPGKDYPIVRRVSKGHVFTGKFATKHYRRRANPKEWAPAADLTLYRPRKK